MTRRWLSCHFALGLTCALLAGCDDKSLPPTSSLPAPTFGNASISGQVRFLGTPPELKIIDTSKCHPDAKPVLEESIVVGANQGLKDVIVYVVDAPASDGSAQPMLKLDQLNCVYSPHVLPIQVNQKLELVNSDPTFHNTHWVSERNGDSNIGIKAGGAPNVVSFSAPEFVRVRCDVHPWMEAWVGVLNHPFFTSTSRDGTFKIDKVPPGEHKLRAWHPLLGEREATIAVSDAATAEVTIDFAPPK